MDTLLAPVVFCNAGLLKSQAVGWVVKRIKHQVPKVAITTVTAAAVDFSRQRPPGGGKKINLEIYYRSG